jgi:hypothetical protein
MNWIKVNEGTTRLLSVHSPVKWSDCRMLVWVDDQSTFTGPSLGYVLNGKWVVDGLDECEHVTHYCVFSEPGSR